MRGGAAWLVAAVLVVACATGRGPYIPDRAYRELQRGDVAYQNNAFARAGRHYDHVIELTDGNLPASVYRKRASVFLAQHRHQEGLDWIERVAEPHYPGDPELLELKATFLLRLRRRDEAIEVAEAAVARDPSRAAAQLMIAEDCYTRGEFARAIGPYEAYLDAAPTHWTMRATTEIKLGYSYLQLEDYDRAARLFEDVLQARPSPNLAMHARKGLCAVHAGRRSWHSAITTCEQVIRDMEGRGLDPSPYYNVGLAYLALHRTDDLEVAARTYVRLRPHSPKGYLLMGRLYLYLGDTDQARIWLEQAAARGSEEARKLLETLP